MQVLDQPLTPQPRGRDSSPCLTWIRGLGYSKAVLASPQRTNVRAPPFPAGFLVSRTCHDASSICSNSRKEESVINRMPLTLTDLRRPSRMYAIIVERQQRNIRSTSRMRCI